MSVHNLLAAVGPAVGGRLRSLTLRHAQLPRTADSAAGAMQTLGARYPHLEVLSLRVPFRMDASAAKALSRMLLQAVPALPPLCPALLEVRVDVRADCNAVQLQWHPDGGVAAVKFVGSCFD